MKYFRISIYFLVLFFPVMVFAQGKQANNWYFGEYAGLSFNSGTPPETLLNGQINAAMNTGTACISDQDGNLLFYSNGVTIWNKFHQVLVNGTDMGVASMQGGIFIQDMVNENLYYFLNFNIDDNLTSLQYSVIDASTGNGGSVIPDQKCISLYMNSTGHLSAVRHANGQDIWVLTHESGSDVFLAFLLTPDGISATPVISAVGAMFSEAGYLKFSPDGNWIASGNRNETGNSQLYRFNNQTGIVNVDFVMTLPVDAIGVEFSPDSKKFYVNDGSIALLQYDLINPIPDQILASQVLLYGDPSGFGALQLGPDGKIYITSASNSISVIHNPNVRGVLCNFESNAIYFESQNCRMSFPNFIQSFFRDPYFSTTQNCAGFPTNFTIGNQEGIDSVFWKFKDIGNQPLDTSTLLNPSYTFSEPGTYYPELTVYSGFLFTTVKDTVVIHPEPKINSFFVTTDVCSQGIGTIQIYPLAGNPEDYWYSLNGVDFIQNGGFFNGLYAGVYAALLRDESGCTSAYLSFPIIITDLMSLELNVVGYPDIINTPLAEGIAVISPSAGGPYTVEVDGNIQTVENDTISGLNVGSHNITITNLIGCSFVTTLMIEGILGLNEGDDESSFSIYQDFNNNTIYLDLPKTSTSKWADAEIRTINGQLLKTHVIETPRTEINLSGLPKGIYAITVHSDKMRKSFKFIIR